jgi:hypothetical protein
MLDNIITKIVAIPSATPFVIFTVTARVGHSPRS